MEKKFEILKGLILKGGNMYKKVLAVMVMCLFVFSNVGFAKTLVPNSAVKSAVDNIAIESALKGTATPEQLKNITALFETLAAEDVNGMWTAILRDLKITTDKFITELTSNEAVRAEKVVTSVDRTENSITFATTGEKRYVSVVDGKIVLSKDKPSESGDVGEFESEELALKVIAYRWKTGKSLTRDEKRKLGEAILNHLSDVDLEQILKDVRDEDGNPLTDENGKPISISVKTVIDMLERMAVKQSPTWADAKGNFSSARGEGIYPRMILPTEVDGIDDLADLAFHEILEALGLKHRDIRTIQKAIAKAKGIDETEEARLGRRIMEIVESKKTDAQAEVSSPLNQTIEGVANGIQKQVAETKESADADAVVDNSTKETKANEDTGLSAALASSQIGEREIGYAAVLEAVKKYGIRALFDEGTLLQLGVTEKDLGKALDFIDLISSLGNPDAPIPMIEATMVGEVDNAGEVKLHNFIVPILTIMKDVKFKPNAAIYVFGVNNPAELTKAIDKMVGKEANIFKPYAGDETTATVDMPTADLARVHVIYTQENKERKLAEAGAKYFYISIDNAEAINGLKLLQLVLQGKGDKVNDVLIQLAAGELTLDDLDFALLGDLRFKVEVVKAILERA